MISARAKCIAALVIAVVLAGVGAVIAVQSGAWAKWRARQIANRAASLERDGAKEAARVAALRALAQDRDSLPAARTLLAVLPPSDVNAALLLRLRIADLDPADHDNLLQLARLALAIGRFDIAEKVALDLGRAAGETPTVLELRAHIPAARGDFAAARKAAAELLERKPGHVVGRVILAVAQVNTGTATAATEQELTALSAVETVRLEALRALRDAALRRNDAAQALTFAKAAAAEKRADFTDRLAQARLAVDAQPDRLDAELAELAASAGNDPRALGRIAVWLRQAGRADRIEPWIAGNDALQRDPMTAKLIRAEWFAAQAEWENLDALVAEGSWGEMEFLRLGLQARVARGRKDEAAFGKAWRAATAAALAQPGTVRMFADTLRTWPEFEQELEELLWSAARAGLQNAGWSLTELQRRAAVRKDTRTLRRVSDAMCETFPESAPAKNNLAFYSLLLGVTPERAHRLAEELYAAHPANATIASTYAISLLRRGRGGEALAALEKLPPKDLRQIAVYHALALAAAGSLEKAQARAAEVVTADLLPEELELLRGAGLPLKP